MVDKHMRVDGYKIEYRLYENDKIDVSKVELDPNRQVHMGFMLEDGITCGNVTDEVTNEEGETVEVKGTWFVAGDVEFDLDENELEDYK